MKRGRFFLWLFGVIGLWCIWSPFVVHAEIASDDAFEGVKWEKILEDDIEGETGVVQSICATEDYIICLENYRDGTEEPDIIKAYYRNDTDAYGNSVEKYSLAMRVVERSYEHANGMAYNPNTGEIAVALYTHLDPENRGCIFLMDSKTLSFKRKVKISDDYNILGIDYDEDNDRYVIQTNVDGGYSFKILDNQFQVVEDLGEYAHTAKGDNFQDLCVSGDYIINFPLTLHMGIGDFIHVYSISRRAMVSDPQLDFSFENVVSDEPESICELEPGLFIAAVNVVYGDGRRTICVYQTMVPYNFPAAAADPEEAASEPEAAKKNGTESEGKTETESEGKTETKVQTKNLKESGKNGIVAGISEGFSKFGEKIAGWFHERSFSVKDILKVVLLLFVMLDVVLLLYLKVVSVRRKRRRKLERARRERQRIRAMYEE